jgi:hypothetical protein
VITHRLFLFGWKKLQQLLRYKRVTQPGLHKVVPPVTRISYIAVPKTARLAVQSFNLSFPQFAFWYKNCFLPFLRKPYLCIPFILGKLAIALTGMAILTQSAANRSMRFRNE